ncbi:hypothetical protein BS78_10G184100 [Paspalum vaginatum]|nr:hypothetical protein BS78_10G184100 [Paspalum vaginatum]
MAEHHSRPSPTPYTRLCTSTLAQARAWNSGYGGGAKGPSALPRSRPAHSSTSGPARSGEWRASIPRSRGALTTAGGFLLAFSSFLGLLCFNSSSHGGWHFVLIHGKQQHAST